MRMRRLTAGMRQNAEIDKPKGLAEVLTIGGYL